MKDYTKYGRPTKIPQNQRSRKQQLEKPEHSGAEPPPWQEPKRKFSFASIFWGRLFPIPFFLVGLFTFFMGINTIDKAKSSVNWPISTGVITDSFIVTSHKDGSTLYRAQVLYSYMVNGQEYTSDKMSFITSSSGSRNSAEKQLRHFPRGKEVDVHYNPDNHSEATLTPGMQKIYYLFPAVGILFTGVAICMLLFLPKVLEKKRRR